MKRFQLLAAVLVLAVAAPVAGQGLPDNIPEPDQSLADRNLERLQERYRPFLSRFFNTSSFDLAPLTAHGLAYQGNVNLGMRLRSGDAITVNLAARNLADIRTGDAVSPEGAPPYEWYYGATYELSGTRFLGETELARRSALGVGLGVLNGQMHMAALEITPTYNILQRQAFSVPVGVKLSLAAVGDRERTLTRTFVGLAVGIRWHWMAHRRLDRLESDAD